MAPWTQARREKARELFDKGLSYEKIASAVGSSRGAISIELRKIPGLVIDRPKSRNRETKAAPAPKPKPEPAAKAPGPKRAPNKRESGSVPLEARVKFEDLGTNACHWPLGGHPSEDPDFGFCGKPQFRGISGHKVFKASVYCEEHFRRSIDQRYRKGLDEAIKGGEVRSP